MTLTQLEYIVALDAHRHFGDAADECHVTQPTLSMQVSKLEQELGVQLFDRSRQPLVPTEAGIEIIRQARRILAERDQLTELVQSRKGVINGELRVGIIPTLAPYLLPLFVNRFTRNYPLVTLNIQELTTEVLIQRLHDGRIDVGVLVTPLQEPGIREEVLFYEELFAYVSRNNKVFEKNYVLPNDIDPGKLWLLEEGHCFRSQIIHLCELRKQNKELEHLQYEAGSIETLRKMVDAGDGITILPELATHDLSPSQQEQLRPFKSPVPTREVSLALHHDFVKRKLVDLLRKTLLEGLPEKIRSNAKNFVVPV